MPFKGRELYIPQFALGRLVEKPSEIAVALDTFLRLPQRTVKPDNALTTGYSFLTQQANQVSSTLAQYGVANQDTLINDTWTANDFRASFFGPTGARRTVAHGLNSLNSHFAHNRFFPNDANDVFADEVTNTTSYTNSLLFSVGCHSGLNVPTWPSASSRDGTDWPQAFNRLGSSWVGNTGFGYADSDLILYSSRLMVNYVQQSSAQPMAACRRPVAR